MPAPTRSIPRPRARLACPRPRAADLLAMVVLAAIIGFAIGRTAGHAIQPGSVIAGVTAHAIPR